MGRERRARVVQPTCTYPLGGFDFENAVQRVVEANKIDLLTTSEHFINVCKACNGGEFQKVTKSILVVNGDKYNFWGKMDVWFEDLIIDIKTTGKYKRSKYVESVQHMIYCHNEQIANFRYLVAVWGKENKVDAMHPIDVHIDDFGKLEEDLVNRVANVISFLKEHRVSDTLTTQYGTLYDVYENKFNTW